jgi:LmbE family N-acetylglucosaminyl deacetylase
LAISPHADDVELACSGTISKLVNQGHDVYLRVLSCLEKEELRNNCIESALSLGVTLLVDNPYKVREFQESRKEILNHFIYLRDGLSPDLVLIPCSKDIHQDHRVCYEEGIRAFKYCSILGYIEQWNIINNNINPNYYIEISEEDLAKKLQVASLFQIWKDKNYTNPEYIKALATFRGVTINKEYAEAFECIRRIESL